MDDICFFVSIKVLGENVVLTHQLLVCVYSIHASNEGDMQVAILLLKHLIQKA